MLPLNESGGGGGTAAGELVQGVLMILTILSVILIVYGFTIVPLLLNRTLTNIVEISIVFAPIAAVLAFYLGGLMILAVDKILTKEENE